MNADPASYAPLVLAVLGLALMIFTVGALAGWRWASPTVRHEPAWIFVTGQVAWGLFLLSLVLTPVREGWGYLPWLAGIAIVGSVVTFLIQVRSRAADRSRGR